MPDIADRSSLPLSDLKAIASYLTSSVGNPAPTLVVQSPTELPDRIREDLGDRADSASGVYDPQTDTVFLVADNIESSERAVSVWTHEQLVHHGLRSLFTENERNVLLDRLWEKSGGMDNGDIAMLSERYGADPEDEESRRFLSEEYLACLAERRSGDLLSQDEQSLWKMIVDFARDVMERISRAVTGKPLLGMDCDELLSSLGRHVVDGRANPIRGAVVTESAMLALREKPEPEKTLTAYKLFRVDQDNPGKLYPLFVKADEPVPMGVWVDAEIGPQAAPSKSGRKQVKAKKGKLAFRPGWHAGDAPCMYQVGTGKLTKRKVNGEKVWQREQREGNHVWAEVRVAADVSYQAEADQNGINPRTGKFVNRDADIKRIPEDGYYRYKTSPTMKGKWIISGSMKVERVLTDREVASINSKTGWPDLPRDKPLVLEKWGFDSETGRPVTDLALGNNVGEVQRILDDNREILSEWTKERTDSAQQLFDTALCCDLDDGRLFRELLPDASDALKSGACVVVDRTGDAASLKPQDILAKIGQNLDKALESHARQVQHANENLIPERKSVLRR